MTDVFISYAREDHDMAHSLARAFDGEGWSVFWDRTIPPGERFDRFIEKKLCEARCIIALWSNATSQSDWVLEEADYGRAKQNLVPALIEEDVMPPLGFRRIQAADLIGWKSEVTHHGYQQLVRTVNGRLSSTNLNSENLLSNTIMSIQTAQDVEGPPSFTSIDEPSQVNEIYDFIRKWFRYLDNHVLSETFRPMISTEDFEMILPEGTMRGMAGFQEWYEFITRIFFNESHVVRDIRLLRSDSQIDADVAITWQAERWRPPEPKSQRLGFDVNLKLKIGRSSSGTPIMLRYSIEELRPLPGSPAL